MSREPGNLPGCTERSLFVRGVLRFPLIAAAAVSLIAGGRRDGPVSGLSGGMVQ